MMVTRDQFVNGLVEYGNEEVIPALPTMGKWIAGSAVYILKGKAENLILRITPTMKTIGIVDENDLIDLDLLTDALMDSANRYGKAELNIPMVGTIRFGSDDVEHLKRHIGKV